VGFSLWPQLQSDKVRGPIIQMSSDLEVASSPRPVFFHLPAPAFLTASPEGGPRLTSISMQSRQLPPASAHVAPRASRNWLARLIIDVEHVRINNKASILAKT
jgi:hypothetical protein